MPSEGMSVCNQFRYYGSFGDPQALEKAKQVPFPEEIQNCAAPNTVGTISFFGGAPSPSWAARAGQEILDSTGGTSDLPQRFALRAPKIVIEIATIFCRTCRPFSSRLLPSKNRKGNRNR